MKVVVVVVVVAAVAEAAALVVEPVTSDASETLNCHANSKCFNAF
jgi:hypothetical protein